jgi:hypothetical protein
MASSSPASSPPAWKILAIAKRKLQVDSIPPEWRLSSIPSFVSARDYIRSSNLLTPSELAITEITDARVLQAKLFSRELSALDVATAFCKRAAIAHQLVGCCTEMFFERALERARELDRYFEENGVPVGPLHGIPVSFKDNFDVKGVDSTIGEFWTFKIIGVFLYQLISTDAITGRMGWTDRQACEAEQYGCGFGSLSRCSYLCEDKYSAVINGKSDRPEFINLH